MNTTPNCPECGVELEHVNGCTYTCPEHGEVVMLQGELLPVVQPAARPVVLVRAFAREEEAMGVAA